MDGESGEKIRIFFKDFKQFHYKKGETILHPGDTPSGVIFLTKGYARLYAISESGKELTLVLYRPGEFFPVVWSFFGERASIYAFEALSPVEVRKSTREQFIEFLEQNPDVLMDVTKHIITRFQIALRRMEFLTFGNVTSRLASVLLIYSSEFGRQRKDGHIELVIPFTHKDIASLIGVVRETASLELKKFENRGLIAYEKRHIILKDKKGLEKEASML